MEELEGSAGGSFPKSSCVKIYLCSNPEDSVQERRALRECVFPRLREYCRHTHGLDFRVIDPYEAADPGRWPDQRSRQRLLQACRETSAGPFFVAVLGEKYGSACLPARVEVAEFQQVLQACQRAGISARVLEAAYQRDENAVPASFCLQRRAHAHLTPGTNSDQTTGHTEDLGKEEEGEEGEEGLSDALQSAVSQCVQEGLMTTERADTYYRSALDTDLRFALENRPPDDIINRCLVYIHKITNRSGQRDDEGQGPTKRPTNDYLLSQLCDHFLLSLATSRQLLVYTTTSEWDRRHGYTPAKRQSYTEGLCEQMHSDLLRLIDGSVSMETARPSPRSPPGEALAARERAGQRELCSIYSRLYAIKLPEEEKVRSYLDERGTQRPLLVVGGPCTGKTVLLAHCSQQVKSWLPDVEPVVVICFTNLLLHSSPKHLLLSLWYQVAQRYSQSLHPDHTPTTSSLHPDHTPTTSSLHPDHTPTTSSLHPDHTPTTNSLHPDHTPTTSSLHPDHTPTTSSLHPDHTPTTSTFHPDPNLTLPQLRKCFLSLLSILPSSKRPLVLMLDGLDQVSDTSATQVLQSLPSPLPPDVKLVLSVSSTRTDTLLALRLHYPPSSAADSSVCVELGLVERTGCVRMLASLLSASGRRVTSGQQAVVNRALASCPLTLYARLLHTHTSLWSSASEVTESSLPVGVHSSIASLMDHLEQKHGSALVSRALSYLTLSRAGLTEAELTDLLSSHDEVLAGYVQQDEDPPSRLRVPEVEVERLLMDLEGFVMRRKVAGTWVLFWGNRHFGLVACRRYLSSSQSRCEVHSEMADYFNNRWAYGRAKPLVIEPEQTVSNTAQMKIYIDRQPHSQPYVYKSVQFPSFSSPARINFRKLLELPHHLQKSNRWEELGRGLMMSLGFHQAMLRAGLLCELITLLEEDGEREGMSQLSSPRERALLAGILKASSCLLWSSPVELPMVMEVGLLPFLEVCSELEGYVREVEQERRRGSGVGVVLCPAPSAVPSMQSVLQTGERECCVTNAAGTECGTVVMTLGDCSVRVWKGRGVEELMLSHESPLSFVGVRSSGKFILLTTRCNRLLLWDVKGPETIQEIKNVKRPQSGPDQNTRPSVKGFVVCEDRVYVWWEGLSFVGVCGVNGEPLAYLQCQNTVTCVMSPSGGGFLYCGQERGTVSIFDAKSCSLVVSCSRPTENAFISVILSEDEEQMTCVDSTGSIFSWEIASKAGEPSLVRECYSKSCPTDLRNIDHSEEAHMLLVCEAQRILLWDTCDWELWDQFMVPQGGAFTQAMVSHDGHLLLATVKACPSVLVWRITSGQCVLSLDTCTHSSPLALLKIESTLCAVAGNGCLTWWDSELLYAAGMAPKMQAGVREVVVESMGERFYVTDRSETVWRWGLGTGSPEANFLHDSPVERICLSPDGSHLVTLSGGDVYVWQSETGDNLHRIHGSKATNILITPNGNFGVCLSERGLTRVWKLATGGVICSIHLYLGDAQISPESTFLIGLRRGDLLAASLWSGSVNKRFSCSECSEHVLAFRTLPEHSDFVVVMTASGGLYTWRVSEETVCRQFQLPPSFRCQPQVFQMSSGGSYVLLSIDDDVITLLDLFSSRLCSLRAEGPVFKVCLDGTGIFVVYISHPPAHNDGCTCDLHSKPVLTVIRLIDGSRVGRLCLCKSPLTLVVCKKLCVYVGFQDGSVGVYSISDAKRNLGTVWGKTNLIGQGRPCRCDRVPFRWLSLAKPNITWLEPSHMV